MSKSTIEWTDEVWNPVTGCTKVSAGCKNCYAEREWTRMTKLVPAYAGRAFTDVRCHPGRMETPLRWQKPRKVFVNSMSDLFHPDVPDAFIDQVFAVMALARQHTFQILTKRPERMREYLIGLAEDDEADGKRITTAVNAALLGAQKTWGECGSTSTSITTISSGTGAREPSMLRSCEDGVGVERLVSWADGEKWMRCADIYAERVRASGFLDIDFGWGLKMWPLPNAWLGVSVEDQATADERIPLLLQTPAAVRWISAEPLLGSIDLSKLMNAGMMHSPSAFIDGLRGGTWGEVKSTGERGRITHAPLNTIDWVVVGGESGPNARPMHPQWARDLRDQCAAAGVAFLFKQWGEWASASDIPKDTALPYGHWAWISYAGDDLVYGFTQFKINSATHQLMARVGKKRAGRLLDGVTHDGYPGGA